jgi:8-amino-3,8-dideoxy-alpha-D-manno-octulosonate transaminase
MMDMTKLAIEGSKPARSLPLPPNYPGAVLFGAEEAESVSDIIHAQSPFRYYGPNVRNAVRTFEDEMARQLGVPYVLGVTSCTAALVVALKALGIGYGDKVIVPAITFLATPGAVICANAVPVFVDTDESMNMDPNDLERLIDKDVKAIIAVSILGNPCDMDPIMEIAKKHNLYVIEDVAQSCGASYKGKLSGTIGHIGVFSFQMNKILTAGEGGAIVTSDPALFERAVRYHDQGMFREKARYGIESDEEVSAIVGQNYRMSEITGAVLNGQWKKLDGIVSVMQNRCRELRSKLTTELENVRFRRIADPAGDIGSNLGMILPSASAAQTFRKALAAENIGTYMLYGGKPVYMIPQLFHQKTAEKDNFPFNYSFENPVVYTEDMCPNAVDYIARTVYVPISPILKESDVEEMAEGIIKVYRHVMNVQV